MPTNFDMPDPETGEFRPVKFYYVTDVARILHTSREWVRAQCDAGIFPALRVGNRYYLNAEHIARAYEVMTTGGLAILTDELDPPPQRLGVVIDPDDVEGVR